jgi:pimeloyl-ACP methyl ester carboxylesterase
MDRNWALTERIAGAKIEIPSLFIGGRQDPVLVMTPPESTVELLTDHRGTVLVDDAGHWVQQQKPDEVNAALIGFLNGLS